MRVSGGWFRRDQGRIKIRPQWQIRTRRNGGVELLAYHKESRSLGRLRADAASGTIVWLAQVFAAATQQHDCRALAPILPYVNEPSRRLWRSSEL